MVFMESERLKKRFRADFSYEPDPCEREALSKILETDLENSLNDLERKLKRYWETAG